MKRLDIGNHVRKHRFLNGEMTQKDLANAVSVSRQTIGAIEKGQYSPTLELCFKLSIIFDTPIDQIFFVEAVDGVEKEQNHES